MSPYHENVVNVTPPSMWLVWRMYECVCLEFGEEQISVRWSHACTHGCAVFLEIEVAVEFENVHVENHSDEVAESLCAYGGRRAVASVEAVPTSVNTLIVWYIAIE